MNKCGMKEKVNQLTWISEEQREAEAALDDKGEAAGREVQGDDALRVRAK